MLKIIDHIGVAVKDLANAAPVFERLFGYMPDSSEEVDSEGVQMVFFDMGNIRIELLEATTADSPIAKFIDHRGEGIHHIAYLVEDLTKEVERLKGEGFEIVGEEPKWGADNKKIQFIHPKSTNGVLIELCQKSEG